MAKLHRIALLGLVLFAAACGDDDGALGTGGDDGGAGGSGGAGVVGPGPVSTSTGLLEDGALGVVTAPDETSIRIPFGGDVAPPSDTSSYAVTSPLGHLPVIGLVIDGATRTVVLYTAKQRLGVTYDLAIAAPGATFDGATARFVAADTAQFWASNFETYRDYRVTAHRAAVGEHGVYYVEEGWTAYDADYTRETFDERTFPVERAAFTDPPDRDGNERIVFLGVDGRDWYGGYFNPLDTMTDAEAVDTWGSHSNEREIIYFNMQMGGFDAEGVVPHEFSHLLYAEAHGALDPWSWHNEGLAECAVTAVFGENDRSGRHYVTDPEQDIRRGLSLVKWQYGNYSQYAQAYVFLSYAASRLGGVDGYSELFHESGDPTELDAFFQDRLGASFGELQLHALAAAWLREEEGPFGFEGLIELPHEPQLSPLDELALRPFAGAFFRVGAAPVEPSGAGADVLHLGVGEDGARDGSAPFDVPFGIVIALNGLLDADSIADESSGALDAAVERRSRPARRVGRDRSWMHPPPLPPLHPDMRRFREATRSPRPAQAR